jgi:hypothetical protein
MPREAMAREAVTREPMPREAMIREAMLRPPPVPVERQRLESLIKDAGAPPPDAGPAFYPLPVPPSFELAPHAPPVPPPFELVFQIPPPPEPKRMPAPPLPQRAAQDEESNLAEMAQRLEVALRRPTPRQTLSLEGSGLPPGEPVYVEPPPPCPVREAMPCEAMAREAVTREPMPREAMTREAMLRPPPVPVERQRLESLIEDAGAPPLLPTPPPDAGPAFYPLPVPPSFELAPHAPPVPPPSEPVFQIPPPPEPKRMLAPPLPQRATQDEESNLAGMAQRLETALRRPRRREVDGRPN